MTTKTNGDTHHGIPVLALHVGDTLPAPTYPVRYAINVSPDLARYLLTFNHPNNRSVRPRKVRAFVADIRGGRLILTPGGIVFDITGTMVDGQHRLFAIAESGIPSWIVVDFGWPEGTVRAIDRGTGRTTADMLSMASIENSGTLAAAHSRVWQYERLAGTSRGLAGFDVPTNGETEAAVLADIDAWQEACRRGLAMYRGLDKAGSAAVWSAFFYLIGKASADRAAAFFDELHDGTGTPKSSTRLLADWFRRRPAAVTRTGDSREPMELMVRAWNGWLAGRSFAFPKYRGFEWSRIRSPKA